MAPGIIDGSDEVLFQGRADAGRRLADRLAHLEGRDLVVLGLPRGGVPVAAEVARALGAPLDVVVVRKLGAPRNPEYALGAIGENGVRVLNQDAVRATRTSTADLDLIESRERDELVRRTERYRAGRPAIRVAGRTAVIVDDGVATGSTARAACLIVRALGAGTIILAVPVAPTDWVERVGPVADEFVAVETPAHFMAVGQWYTDFRQTTDDEVVRCLRG